MSEIPMRIVMENSKKKLKKGSSYCMKQNMHIKYEKVGT